MLIEKYIKKVLEQKRKLYEKSMTYEGIMTEWDRYLDLYDYLYENVTWVNIVTSLILNDLISGFDLPPIETPYPFTIPPEYRLPPGYKKAYYGISKYDESYYDPEEWIKALKQLVLYIIQVAYNYPSANINVKALAESLGISEDIVRWIMDRVLMLLNIIKEYHICGFVICGVSKLGKPEVVDKELVGFTSYINSNMELSEIDHASIFEPAYGTICGLTPCGLGRAVPRKSENYVPILPPEFSWFIDRNVSEQMDRFVFNRAGFKRYEGVPFFRSTKAELYGEKVTLLYHIRRIVKSILRRYGLDPVKVNTYIDFAYEYVFGKYKKHKPSKYGFAYLTYEDFEKYLIEKWKKAGLDEKIMREIIERLRHLHEVVKERRLRGIY